MPNPKPERAGVKGSGQRAKTEGQDACVLTQYAAERHAQPQPARPAAVQTLDELLRCRADLEQMLRHEHNRQHSLSPRPYLPAAVTPFRL